MSTPLTLVMLGLRYEHELYFLYSFFEVIFHIIYFDILHLGA